MTRLLSRRGQALGNGSLVRAIQHATRKRPIMIGKRAGHLPSCWRARRRKNPSPLAIAWKTDIMGAVATACPPCARPHGRAPGRDVIRAPRGQRPSYLAIDMRGLLEAHPAPKHHRDGTWTLRCFPGCEGDPLRRARLDDEVTEPSPLASTPTVLSLQPRGVRGWRRLCRILLTLRLSITGIRRYRHGTRPTEAPSVEDDDFFDVAANADDLRARCPDARVPAR